MKVDSSESLFRFDGRNTLDKNYESGHNFLVSILAEDHTLSLYNILTQSDNSFQHKKLHANMNSPNQKLTDAKFWSHNKMLTCGYDVNLELLDLEQSKSIWKSKSGARDELNLVIPIKSKAMCFDPQSGQVWVCSANRTIGGYRINQQRKPVCGWTVSDGEDVRLDKIVTDISGTYLYVTDVLGSLIVYDKRKPQNMVKRVKDSLGCYSDLKMSPDGQTLSTVGLDRHLRVYSLKLGVPTLICEKYLKTKPFSIYYEDNVLSQMMTIGQTFSFKEKMTTRLLKEESNFIEMESNNKFDIEEVFASKKEEIHQKLKKRIKKKVHDQFKEKRIKSTLNKQ